MNPFAENAGSRRGFLATAAVATAVVALKPAMALAVQPALKFKNIPGKGDIQVLNYALALEDLEAELYVQALARLTHGDKSRGIKGLNLPSGSPDVEYLKEFGMVEAQHRDFLRAAISAAGGPVLPNAKHNFNINSLNRLGVDNLVYTAEALGVAAYLGAIPLLSMSSPYLQIAGAIEGTEARHTAVIAATIDELFKKSIPVAPLAGSGSSQLSKSGIDTPLPPDTVLEQVSPYIVG